MIAQLPSRQLPACLVFLTTLLVSGFFAIIHLAEFVSVGLLKKTSGYPFGGEGPTPWYYKTPQAYLAINLFFGLLFCSIILVCCWAFIKLRNRILFLTFSVMAFLIFAQLLNAQLD